VSPGASAPSADATRRRVGLALVIVSAMGFGSLAVLAKQAYAFVGVVRGRAGRGARTPMTAATWKRTIWQATPGRPRR